MHKLCTLALGLATLAGCTARNSSTLRVLPDGGVVVAEGRPPIGFAYPGTGAIIVRDLTARSTVYSMDLPRDLSTTSVPPAPITIVGDQLVANDVPGSDKIVLLRGLLPQHRYQIIHRPAGATTRPADH